MQRDDWSHITLHILAHLAEATARPTTSEETVGHFCTNPGVIRRSLAGLRAAGIVASAKGHGGGWTLARSTRRSARRVALVPSRPRHMMMSDTC